MRVENILLQPSGWYYVPLLPMDTAGQYVTIEMDTQLGLAVINPPCDACWLGGSRAVEEVEADDDDDDEDR